MDGIQNMAVSMAGQFIQSRSMAVVGTCAVVCGVKTSAMAWHTLKNSHTCMEKVKGLFYLTAGVVTTGAGVITTLAAAGWSPFNDGRTEAHEAH